MVICLGPLLKTFSPMKTRDQNMLHIAEWSALPALCHQPGSQRGHKASLPLPPPEHSKSFLASFTGAVIAAFRSIPCANRNKVI